MSIQFLENMHVHVQVTSKYKKCGLDTVASGIETDKIPHLTCSCDFWHVYNMICSYFAGLLRSKCDLSCRFYSNILNILAPWHMVQNNSIVYETVDVVYACCVKPAQWTTHYYVHIDMNILLYIPTFLLYAVVAHFFI